VTQASSSWRQLINQVPEIKTGSPKQRNLKRLSEPGFVLGFLTVLVAMLLWNWKLLLALAVGIGVMVLAYSIQKWNWQLRWLEISQFLHSANSRLALAVASGGIATVITYMTAAIWVDAHSPWIAAGIIVQGLGTLLTLILLVWQIFSLNSDREENYLEHLYSNLTQQDSLKRLLAVRQLTKFMHRQHVNSAIQQEAAQYLQLLLNQEEEPVIREAILDSLQSLHKLNTLPTSTAQPITPAVPLSLKTKEQSW
jgi:hypothetical protein